MCKYNLISVKYIKNHHIRPLVYVTENTCWVYINENTTLLLIQYPIKTSSFSAMSIQHQQITRFCYSTECAFFTYFVDINQNYG